MDDSYYEIFDILNKCFGNCLRCKRYLSCLPMTEEIVDDSDILSKQAHAEGGFDKSLIRLFHSL